jgi:predicted nucleic acid-binding protein
VIVVDASVVVAALLVAGPDGDAARAILGEQEAHAPHLLDVEATAAARRWLLSGRLHLEAAQLFLGDLRALAIARHGHEPLLDRVLELRNCISAYDASYVALAELLEVPLATGDRRLARAPGIRCEVLVPEA